MIIIKESIIKNISYSFGTFCLLLALEHAKIYDKSILSFYFY